MLDEQSTTVVTENQPGSSAGTVNTEQSIPYSRFKEVNDAKKAAEERLAQLEEAERQRQEEEAKKRGDYESLVNSLKPQAERAQALEKTLTEYLEAEIADVPEDKRSLIPQGDVTMRLAWLKQAKAAGLFGITPKAPNTDAGVTGDKPTVTKLSDAQREMARQFGMTDEEYAKYISKK